MARLPRPARRTPAAVPTRKTIPAATDPSASPGWSDTSGADLVPRDAEAAIPHELKVAAAYSWRFIVVGIALWGLMQILSATTTVVIPIAVALLLTGLLMPFAVFLNHRLAFPRHAAAAVTVLIFMAVVIGLLSLAGSQLISGVPKLVDQAGLGMDQVTRWLQDGPLHIGDAQMTEYLDAGRTWLKEHGQNLSTGALRASGTATEFLAGILITLISTFFFLAEGDRIWSWMVRLLPGMYQERVHEGFRRGWVTLGSYAKTQCIVAAVDAVFIAIGAGILGLPLLIPMGLIIFFGSFIPIVGAVISASLAVLVALFVKGPVAALIMLGIILLVQQVEGHILQPVLMSKAVALHPLAVILGVGLGSFLLGMVGALFSVPFMAVVNTVMSYWAGHDNFPGLAQGGSAVGMSAKDLAGESSGDDDVPEEEDRQEDQTRKIGSVTPMMLAEQSERMAAARRRA
ncbi:hypothetical protein KEM60_00158 [Austwickia sp. TVS 96-490-7B]|uniref:AI-2E family transporter n=1 Tax=Austwickia sp. TVS 96-490-7B TaxID=2830843 RepID=UPI001C595450|nr:AI-2E family transporter [Austwickia sp. TVS 96-490-7B]MBW3083975.1 hypothetical protein [Austwickia sp. TVS 96-490-7B]